MVDDQKTKQKQKERGSHEMRDAGKREARERGSHQMRDAGKREARERQGVIR